MNWNKLQVAYSFEAYKGKAFAAKFNKTSVKVGRQIARVAKIKEDIYAERLGRQKPFSSIPIVTK